MEDVGKSKKLISLIFFLVYIGCIMLCAQEIPRSYVAYKTLGTLSIDGKADEPSWDKAPWSDFFIDIEGVKKPTYSTQMKILWDENHIYFFAQMEEPHVWANLKQRDTVIFYNNDFEIFIDPDGDSHTYYEYEVNALNTGWDLFLTKPYRNQGRVLNSWDIMGLKTAVHINGTLNNAADIDKGWSVEIAIPWSELIETGSSGKVPVNEFWRLNFSRVNWDFDITNGKYSRKKNKKTGHFLPEYNWVWSPQYVINMHEPERWGYVFFSENSIDDGTIDFEIPKDEYLKWYLYELYRNLISNDGSGKRIWKTTQVEKFNPTKELFGQSVSPVFEKYDHGFTIWVKSPFTHKTLKIKEDGKFQNYD